MVIQGRTLMMMITTGNLLVGLGWAGLDRIGFWLGLGGLDYLFSGNEIASDGRGSMYGMTMMLGRWIWFYCCCCWAREPADIQEIPLPVLFQMGPDEMMGGERGWDVHSMSE
jgi:hypothetical protein